MSKHRRWDWLSVDLDGGHLVDGRYLATVRVRLWHPGFWFFALTQLVDAHTRKHVRTWHHTAKPQAPANQQMRETFTPLERLALYITEKVGSIGFFVIIQVSYFLWIGLNGIAFTPHFDPGPGYVLLLFISNYIQLTLMPLLMIGQNLQGRHAELRAEDEYRISQDTNEEVKTLRAEVARLHALLTQRDDERDAERDTAHVARTP